MGHKFWFLKAHHRSLGNFLILASFKTDTITKLKLNRKMFEIGRNIHFGMNFSLFRKVQISFVVLRSDILQRFLLAFVDASKSRQIHKQYAVMYLISNAAAAAA